ncbi:hypothetical protein C8Q79DRAFT_996331 [Trametes meyenii]|nr:hypothetical protein C8Q79DRAFT_996331 [Trametes meyenii]
MATLLLDAYELYPTPSADEIIVSFLDAFVGACIEQASKGVAITPGATGYPYFLRLKTGITTAYSLPNFTKEWRDPEDVRHLQVLPEIDHVTRTISNDILSFYNEPLAGETDNYIHMRAATEEKPPLAALRDVVAETVETVNKIENVIAGDSELETIFRSFKMGLVEFHSRAKRYHLEDLTAAY